VKVFIDSNVPMYVAGREHPHREPARRVSKDLLVATEHLSTRDAVHAAVMINREVEWIASFDADFDQVPGLRRLELPLGDCDRHRGARFS